jgi:hypothetical protein
MQMAAPSSAEKLRWALGRQDGTSSRYFAARKRDWDVFTSQVNDAEQMLDSLDPKEAEYLRLVYGVSRPQLSVSDAADVVFDNQFHTRWGTYKAARDLLFSMLVARSQCPRCGGTGVVAP